MLTLTREEPAVPVDVAADGGANKPVGGMSIRSLRIRVLIALAAAFGFEIIARVIHAKTTYHPLVGEGISMLALMLLCGSALYLILWLRDTPVLKWTILLATGFLLLSQLLNVAEDFEPFADIVAAAPWHNDLEGLILLSGLILMIATLYLALFEAVAMRQTLMGERRALRSEVAERKQAQALLFDSQERLRRLSAHTETLRENERATIAREIHDELGQTLTSLKIDLSNLKRRTTTPTPEVLEILDSMTEQLNGTMQVIRRIITELRPGVLDDLGLLAAIEWQTRDFQKRTGITCTLDAATVDHSLGRDRSTAIFRILQEALTNIVRHSRATEVTVRVTEDDTVLVMEVHDNGRGFDVGAAEASRSFGLMGMRERAAQLEGEVRLTSAIDGGTAVVVRMPLLGLANAAADASQV